MLGLEVRASQTGPPLEQVAAGGLVRQPARHPAAWRRLEGLAAAGQERLLTTHSVHAIGAEVRIILLADSAADAVLVQETCATASVQEGLGIR